MKKTELSANKSKTNCGNQSGILMGKFSFCRTFSLTDKKRTCFSSNKAHAKCFT